ncbi:MAG: CHASE3 domain-containing protein [Bacteroidetes bacterium]|nr:CHASE3 domain-containing protein [Bacteroidota bacterium]
MRWSVGTKIGGGFALALAILVVIGVMAYRSTTELIDAAQMKTHTYEVLKDLDGLLSTMENAETGQRGYIITGEKNYLQPYNAAISVIDPEIQRIRELTSDNASQQRRLDTLAPLIKSKIDELKLTIELRESKGFQAASQVVLSDEGKQKMDDIRKVVARMENEENGLLVVRDARVNADTQRTISTILYGIPFAFLLLAFVGFFTTRDIARPLRRISDAAELIASGDLTVSVPSNNRRDEVGVLTQTFDRMARFLQEMAKAAEKIAAGYLNVQVKPQSQRDVLGNAFAAMVENLRGMTNEIREGVNVLASSASEILAATTQVASGAAETAAAVSETTTTVEEVKQTAQVASQKSKYVSDNAQRMVHASESGKKSVQESIDGMNHIREQMDSIGESIVRLSEQSQAIGEIIATVNDLAEQSNLLAVNAAIEAAKAGEQGKGFAVVAQEIKSLAEQSKQASAQVRAILSDIQKATGAAVMATEQGTKAVEAGVKQSTTAGESIRMMADSIAESTQAAAQIAASSQQQLIGMDQVASAMENIKQASTQNVASTKQAETAAQGLHDLGQKLKELVERFKV